MIKILCDGKILHHDKSNIKVAKAKMESQINSISKLSLDIQFEHPLYFELYKMKSKIVVYEKDNIIFKGRIKNISIDRNNTKKITCDSELSFLLNYRLRPQEYKFKEMKSLFELILKDLKEIFDIGIVDVDPKKEIIYKTSNYEKIFEFIKEKLIGTYGGYLYLDFKEEKSIINYVNKFKDRPIHKVIYGKNLLDYEKTEDSSNFATVIIPLGSSNNLDKKESGFSTQIGESLTIESVNGGKDFLEDKEAIKEYGRIEKVVEFKDIKDPRVLKKRGIEELKKAVNFSKNIKVKAIDFEKEFKLGDQVQVESKKHGIKAVFLINRLNIDLFDRANSIVELGDDLISISKDNLKLLKKEVVKIDDKFNYTKISTDKKILEQKNGIINYFNENLRINYFNEDEPQEPKSGELWIQPDKEQPGEFVIKNYDGENWNNLLKTKNQDHFKEIEEKTLEETQRIIEEERNNFNSKFEEEKTKIIETSRLNSISESEKKLEEFKEGLNFISENLMVGTRDFSGEWFDNNQGNTLKELLKNSIDYNGFTILNHNQPWTIISQQFHVKAGEKYTFSFLAKLEELTGKVGVRLTVGVNNIPQLKVIGLNATTDGRHIAITATNEFKEYSVKFEVISDGIITPTIEVNYNTAANKKIYFGAFKLEKGDLKTPWIQNKIDDFKKEDSTEIEINKLKLGIYGRNLLKGTRTFENNWNIEEEKLKGMLNRSFEFENVKIISHTNPMFKVGQRYDLEEGKTYNFSFYGKIVDEVGSIGIYFRDIQTPEMAKILIYDTDVVKGVGGIRCTWNNATNEIKRFTVKFKCLKAGFILPYVEVGLTSGKIKTIWFGGFKLEEGENSTKWTPHPSDDFEELQKFKSELKKTNDEIKASVTSINAAVLKKSEIAINNSGITLGTGNFIDGNKIASLITINPNAIDLISQNVRIKGNAIVDGSIQANHLLVTKALIDKLMAQDILTNSLISTEAFIKKIKATDILGDKIKGGKISGVNIEVIGGDFSIYNNAEKSKKALYFDAETKKYIFDGEVRARSGTIGGFSLWNNEFIKILSPDQAENTTCGMTDLYNWYVFAGKNPKGKWDQVDLDSAKFRLTKDGICYLRSALIQNGSYIGNFIVRNNALISELGNRNILINGAGSYEHILGVYDKGYIGIYNNAYVCITRNGGIKCNSLNNTSDIRMKENIQEINKEEAYEFVKNTRMVSYNLKNDEEKKIKVGFIAQEVEEKQNQIKKAFIEEKEGYYNASYLDFNNYSIAAVQKLIEKVELLEKKVKEQQECIESLKKRI